jgi:hypothetical protein
MNSVHEYPSKFVKANQLTNSDTMIGESGGLSSCYNNAEASSAMVGLVVIETEHGSLYLDPEEDVEVLL